MEELHNEKGKATDYLFNVWKEKLQQELNEFTDEKKKKKFWDNHPNFKERTWGIGRGVEDIDEKYVKDYEKYVKEKLIHPFLTPPTPPPILDITLFYSEKLDLNLPSSVEVAIAAASWNSALKDKTISEEELEKRTKELYQKYGYEILKVVSNSICFAYYAGKFGLTYKGKNSKVIACFSKRWFLKG